MASLIVQKGFGVNFTNYRSIPGIPTLVASTTGLVCILESTHDIYIYIHILSYKSTTTPTSSRYTSSYYPNEFILCIHESSIHTLLILLLL